MTPSLPPRPLKSATLTKPQLVFSKTPAQNFCLSEGCDEMYAALLAHNFLHCFGSWCMIISPIGLQSLQLVHHHTRTNQSTRSNSKRRFPAVRSNNMQRTSLLSCQHFSFAFGPRNQFHISLRSPSVLAGVRWIYLTPSGKLRNRFPLRVL